MDSKRVRQQLGHPLALERTSKQSDKFLLITLLRAFVSICFSMVPTMGKKVDPKQIVKVVAQRRQIKQLNESSKQ